MADVLRLTRNQLATICHNDAESIRQLELLVSSVNALATSGVSAPGETVILADGDAIMQVQMSAGRWLIDVLVLATGDASVSLGGTVSLAPSTLSTTASVAGVSVDPLKSSETGTIYSGTDNIIVTAAGVIDVTTPGVYGVIVTGTGAVAQGSYFSARQVSA